MIDKISKKISEKIQKITGKTEEEIQIIDYGLKILMFELVVSSIIICVSSMLGILVYVMVAAVVFGMLRITGGGAHGKTRQTCFIEYLTFILLTIYTSMIIKISFPVLLLILISILIVFTRYAPGDTSEKPIKSRILRRRLKFTSILVILVLYALAYFIRTEKEMISNIIVLSSIHAMLLLSPVGYKFMRCNHGH